MNPPAPAAASARAPASVRRAELRDAEALAELSRQLGYPSPREQVEARLRQLLASAEHAVLVAEDARDGSIAGWVHAYVERTLESDATAEIGGLVVSEGRRGAGVGRLLMEHAERWARGTGCATVTVRSNVIRERAHAFYLQLGYAPVKSQRVFRKTLAS